MSPKLLKMKIATCSKNYLLSDNTIPPANMLGSAPALIRMKLYLELFPLNWVSGLNRCWCIWNCGLFSVFRDRAV
jgi:hypothetical protein